MAVLVLIFTAASVYIFSILAIMLQRSEPLLMSSVTEGTRGLLINFLPFALMTIILAVTDGSSFSISFLTGMQSLEERHLTFAAVVQSR